MEFQLDFFAEMKIKCNEQERGQYRELLNSDPDSEFPIVSIAI